MTKLCIGLAVIAFPAAVLVPAGCGREEPGVREIGPAGGEVRLEGVRVIVPGGALSQATRIRISNAPDGNPPGNIGTAVEIGPDGTSFAQPVVVEFRFEAVQLPDPARPEAVRVATASGPVWEPLPGGSADEQNGLVRGETTHFSRFGVIQLPAGPPGAPRSLAFASAPQTLQVATCSSLATVETRDAYGTPTKATAPTVVGLSATAASVTFHSDAACATAIATVTIPAGGGSAGFFFTSAAPGNVAITASASGLTAARQDVVIASAGAPARLAFVAVAGTWPVGKCSTEAKVQTRDVAGAPANTTAATSVSLSASSPSFAFHSDAACAAPATVVSIPAGSGTANFYYRSTAGGGVTTTATSPGLTSATASTWFY